MEARKLEFDKVRFNPGIYYSKTSSANHNYPVSTWQESDHFNVTEIKGSFCTVWMSIIGNFLSVFQIFLWRKID